MKNKIDSVKIIGLLGTGLALAATLVSDWVSDKKLEETIDKKVEEKLSSNKEI